MGGWPDEAPPREELETMTGVSGGEDAKLDGLSAGGRLPWRDMARPLIRAERLRL